MNTRNLWEEGAKTESLRVKTTRRFTERRDDEGEKQLSRLAVEPNDLSFHLKEKQKKKIKKEKRKRVDESPRSKSI